MTVAAEAPTGHPHPGYTTSTRPMRVVAITRLTDAISHFRLVPADGAPLTPFVPGSHLIVTAGAHRNAYSLVDDGFLPTSYGISVLRRSGNDETDRGGSDWLHRNVSEGTVLDVEGPRSMFAPIWNQRHALLVAGGIGITPVLSHLRSALRRGTSAEVIYSYRRAGGAHLDELRDLAAHPDITLYEVSGADDTRWLLAERLAHQPLGTHAYACGPAPMLAAYLELAAAAGWPTSRVHLERFAAPEQDPGDPFTATVRSTGVRIDIPAGVSLLQGLLDHGVPVPSLCRQGVCGECRIGVRSGVIEHRDFVLTDEERVAADSMLCCVSRGQGIEVDL
ncbi:PDR/VanB family oxidoreductase [Gordonia sp. PKS22-38]|uniref:PDR/VanB family oxidoreductase n=1 Tax=Gordonia prachuapensis TaxID=3115651 RepID=A0ABU7MX16_9ACTN|nr:PDR/VanB family oxidoreductase [Gordonia sp. PKS22-38]